MGMVWVSVSGCLSDDPETISPRPWSAGTGADTVPPIDNGQHK
jgi:hypothetical protein